MSSKDILLITNGYNENDSKIVESYSHSVKFPNKRNEKVAVCVGKFSEYGVDKVKTILFRLNREKVLVKLIGSNFEQNKWIFSFLKKHQLKNISLEILPRLDRKFMYIEILKSDYGLSILRDPNYDFGTKIYDYILCQKPILNYFDKDNNFTIFFKKFLDSYEYSSSSNKSFLREKLILEHRVSLIKALK